MNDYLLLIVAIICFLCGFLAGRDTIKRKYAKREILLLKKINKERKYNSMLERKNKDLRIDLHNDF